MMSHEGRMSRGELKISKGISDSETKYFLANKPKEETVEKPKEEKKETKSKSKE